MSFYVVRYIGDRDSQTVWDALERNRIEVKKGQLFLSNENEVNRLRNLEDSFNVLRKVDIKDLLRGALSSSLRPWSHPNDPALRGKGLFLFHSEGGKYIGQKLWEFQIALSLSEMGYGVHMLTDVIPPYAKEWAGGDKITWERTSSSGFAGFDFVIGTSPISLGDAVKYGSKNKIPCVLIAGEPPSAIPGRRESNEKLAEYNRYLQQAEKVIVPSETSRLAMAQIGVDVARVFVVKPKLNPNLLLTSIKTKANEVVLCGRMDPHKEIRPTIKTLLLSPEDFDITCLVPDAESLQKEFGEGGRNHKLTFLSDVSEKEKSKIFARAKVLVHPSRWEGYGMTVLEAFSMGMRVVARPLTAFRENFGDDILYFSKDIDLNKTVSHALSVPTNGALTSKYREIGQFNQTIPISRLFEKKPISIPTNSTRVAFVGWSLKFGGGVIARIEQGKALQSAGYEVEMGSWGGMQKGLDSFRTAILNTPEDAKKWLKARRPGIIICDGTLMPQIMPAAKELGIPVATFIHFWTPFFRETMNILEKESPNVNPEYVKMLNDVEMVFTNSKYTFDVFKKHLGVDSAIVHPVFNKKRLEARGHFKRTFILTPILEEEPVGLQLFESIVQRLPNRNFKVLYWRGGEHTLERLKKNHPNLTIMDGVEDVGRHYRSAKLFLYTLQVDHTFGLSFAESLHCKTPVIAPALGNLPAIVKKGGKLIKSLRAEDWIDEIEKCFTNEKHYKKLVAGATADAKIVPQTDQSAFVDAIQRILESRKRVSLLCGDFLASRHCFKSLAKIVDGVEIDASECDNLIAFGPPAFWKDKISPNTYCYWASTAFQSEVDNEVRWLKEAVNLVAQEKLGGIISPSDAMLLLARAMGCKRCYKLSVPAPVMAPLGKIERKKGHVSVFHSGQPRKNTINQLLAVLSLDPNLVVHLGEKGGKNVPVELLNSLNIVRHPFLPDDKYFELLASCSVGLQVSVGETFNLAGFQHLALGTPCLISRSCPYSTELPKEYQRLVIGNPDDMLEIKAALDFVLNATRGENYHKGLVEWARWYADKRNKQIKEEFSKIFA